MPIEARRRELDPVYDEGESPASTESIEVSIVIPCLNEGDTVGACVQEAFEALRLAGVEGEVIVADNGSRDSSRNIASEFGARVVCTLLPGYGSALMHGIASARGRYIFMGDADGSYDFCELPKFLKVLREGKTLVQGCRLPTGGGRIEARAMPWLHRWVGNPLFSYLARILFRAPIHDVNCGLRAFEKTLYLELEQRCRGMEFAVEMVIKSALRRAEIGEVPITLRKDKRNGRRPHLRTFRDGWRTLRYFLLSTPLWLFWIPGLLLSGLGFLGYCLAMPRVTFGLLTFDVNTLLVSTMFILLGHQGIVFAVTAKSFGISQGLLPPDSVFERRVQMLTLERGLVFALLLILLGTIGLGWAISEWRNVHWGALDSSLLLRVLLPSVLCISLGVQTMFASFFIGILQLGGVRGGRS